MFAVLLFLVAAVGAPAAAQFAARPTLSRIGAWASAPSNEDVMAVKPPGVTTRGAVTLDCISNEDGSVGRCGIISEEPKGVGLGAAALNLIPKYKLSEADRKDHFRVLLSIGWPGEGGPCLPPLCSIIPPAPPLPPK